MAEFTHVDGKDLGNIKMYALSTCGWCKKTKAFLNDHNVKYAYIDVDLLPMEEMEHIRTEQLKHNPSGSFPTIVIDQEKCIVGFDEQQLLELVGE